MSPPQRNRFDPQSYPETMRFLQRIMKKSEMDIRKLTLLDVTGLQPAVLTHLTDNPDISFEIKELDRSDIHSVLMDFYLTKKCMPTSRELFAGLGSKSPVYMDIENFRKLLLKMGYVYKKTTRFTPVVIENPLVTFERYEYLKKIILFREESKNIIFIDENAVESSGNYFNAQQSIHLAKQCPNQWQQRYIYGVSETGIHCLHEISDFDEDNFMSWISDYLVKYLNCPTVVVFNKEKHHNSAVTIPTLDTVKVDIIAWLDRNGIPHDPDMAKHELFNLVQKCAIKKKVNNVDEILKTYGHTVLRIPDCIKKFTPVTTIFQSIKSELERYIAELDSKGGNYTIADLTEVFKSTIYGFTDDQLKQCWDFIAEEELLQFQVDLEVDRVIDKLIEETQFSVSKDESTSDVPSCEESD